MELEGNSLGISAVMVTIGGEFRAKVLATFVTDGLGSLFHVRRFAVGSEMNAILFVRDFWRIAARSDIPPCSWSLPHAQVLP